jgi:uncharacterized repeat protein (TIGR01451 family)
MRDELCYNGSMDSRGKPATMRTVGAALSLWLALAALASCRPAATATRAPSTPTPTSSASLVTAKLVNPSQAAPGEAVFFTLLAINDMMGGDDPGAQVTLSDRLPPELELVEGSLSSEAGYDVASGTITWSGAVPRGGSIQVTFRARIRPGVLEGNVVLNTLESIDAFEHKSLATAQVRVALPPPLPTVPAPTAEPTLRAAVLTETAVPRPSPAPKETPTYTLVEAPSADAPYVKSLIVTPEDPPIYYLVVGPELYRSDDRGQSWKEEPLPGLLDGAGVQFVAVNYRHAQTMYLGTNQGLYRRESTDQPWSLVNSQYFTALAVDLENPDILWAGIPYDTAQQAVLVKSSDRGRTWAKADFGMAVGWVGAILIHPRNPNVIWAHVRPATRHDWPRGYVYRGGRDGSWERLSLGHFEFVPDPNPFGGANDDVCFVSGLAYDPELNALYAGCDVSWFNSEDRTQRLIRSLNADAPNSAAVRWEVASELGAAPSLQASGVRPLAVDARGPKSLFLSLDVTEEMGQPRFRLLVSADDARSWSPLSLVGLPLE